VFEAPVAVVYFTFFFHRPCGTVWSQGNVRTWMSMQTWDEPAFYTVHMTCSGVSGEVIYLIFDSGSWA